MSLPVESISLQKCPIKVFLSLFVFRLSSSRNCSFERTGNISLRIFSLDENVFSAKKDEHPWNRKISSIMERRLAFDFICINTPKGLYSMNTSIELEKRSKLCNCYYLSK
jgi:hypothetical protein